MSIEAFINDVTGYNDSKQKQCKLVVFGVLVFFATEITIEKIQGEREKAIFENMRKQRKKKVCV